MPGQQATSTGLVPKIMDFGLAKDLAAQLAHTSTGDILGTPLYMSPEQAEAGATLARLRTSIRSAHSLRAARRPAAVARHDAARDAENGRQHRACVAEPVAAALAGTW